MKRPLFKTFFLSLVYTLLFSLSSFATETNQKIETHFFYTASCSECAAIVPKIKTQFAAELDFIEYDLDDLANFEEMLAFEEKFHLRESTNLALFLPNTYVQGKENVLERLEQAIHQHKRGCVSKCV